ISKVKITDKQQNLVNDGLKALGSMAAEIHGKDMSLEAVSPYLVEQQKVYKQFELICLFDDKGRVTAGTELSLISDNDYSYRPYYREAIKGVDYKSEPYISAFSYNYCITVSIPYKDAAGRITGVIMADICIED
ncbi:MAG TPA: cache domain-containing protein, partial [Patescibacteria group bacterium]|nr:cache domain-containing protein [Patescibacteria group bacterium]